MSLSVNGKDSGALVKSRHVSFEGSGDLNLGNLAQKSLLDEGNEETASFLDGDLQGKTKI